MFPLRSVTLVRLLFTSGMRSLSSAGTVPSAFKPCHSKVAVPPPAVARVIFVTTTAPPMLFGTASSAEVNV